MPIAGHDQLEYQALRSAIAAYIRQEFDVMVVVAGGSAGLFAYGFKERQGAPFLCEYVLLFLALGHGWSVAAALRSIATYIRVFHEQDDAAGWESRTARYRVVHRPGLLAGTYDMLYWGLALAAGAAASAFLTGWLRVVPTVAFALWATAKISTRRRGIGHHRTGSQEIVERWRLIRDAEGADAAEGGASARQGLNDDSHPPPG